MRAGLTLRPASEGTRKLPARYGERLVCVRYRYDIEHARRVKTVELVVEKPRGSHVRSHSPPEASWVFGSGGARSRFSRRIRAAGGTWRRELGVWLLPYRVVAALGLQDRIVVRPSGSPRLGVTAPRAESIYGNSPPTRPRR